MEGNKLSHPLKDFLFVVFFSRTEQRKKSACITAISYDIALLEYKSTTDFHAST